MKKLSVIIITLLLVLTIVPVSADFADMTGHWAHDAAKRMSDRNIISGYNGLFRPDDPITRADLCVILDRLLKPEEKSDKKFADLPDAYYTDAVLKMNKAGIIFGYSGHIRPLDSVTRQEAAVMIGRSAAITYSPTPSPFSDRDEIAHWAVLFVDALSEKHYINGTDGLFYPERPITRAEVVTILDNMYSEFLPKQTVDEEETADITETPDEKPDAVEPDESDEELPEDIIEPESEPEENDSFYLTLEAFTVGGGFIIPPTEYSIIEGFSVAQMLDEILESESLKSLYSGTPESGYYLYTVSGFSPFEPEIPDILLAKLEENSIKLNGKYEMGSLSEFDFTACSGFLYCVNNVFPSVSMSDYYPADGDVIRIKYSLAIGLDVGGADPLELYGKNYFPSPSIDRIIIFFAENPDVPIPSTLYKPDITEEEAKQILSELDAE